MRIVWSARILAMVSAAAAAPPPDTAVSNERVTSIQRKHDVRVMTVLLVIGLGDGTAMMRDAWARSIGVAQIATLRPRS
jgi:hypothetical protein